MRANSAPSDSKETQRPQTNLSQISFRHEQNTYMKHMICYFIYHTFKGEYKNLIIDALRFLRFASVHHQARMIGIDRFHHYQLQFSSMQWSRNRRNQETTHSCSSFSSPTRGRGKHIPRRIQPHAPSTLRRETSSRSALLDVRFATLRSDPSLTEVVLGFFSFAAAFGNDEAISPDDALDVYRRQRNPVMYKLHVTDICIQHGLNTRGSG